MKLFELLYFFFGKKYAPLYVYGFTQYDEDGYPTDERDWDDEEEYYDDEDDDEDEWE